VVDAPPHHAIARHLAGRRDLEPQRIGDLTLQRMLGHHDAVSFQATHAGGFPSAFNRQG
jgi:hypothetical protein